MLKAKNNFNEKQRLSRYRCMLNFSVELANLVAGFCSVLRMFAPKQPQAYGAI